LERLNNGSFSTHRTPISIAIKPYDLGIEMGDRNNDGYPDISIISHKHNEVKTFYCGGFLCEKERVFDTGLKGVSRVALGDIDNDGDDDFIASEKNGNQLVVFVNHGETQQRVVIDEYAQGVNDLEIADIYNDGYPDIIAATQKGLLIYKISAGQ